MSVATVAARAARGSRPVTSAYHAGWCVQAHLFVTVPLVIDWNVPGWAAVLW